MGNIIGEGFEPWVIDQINTRQKKYGSINRDNTVLSYLNSKTAWLKLVSGAIVDKSKLGFDVNASQYVLFNGMVDENKSLGSGGRSGIARTDSIYTNTAYGLGGLELGNRPMPGLISANIKTENRGALKTAEVQIKAWNRTQFDIIDVLYLRLGYSVLLEWGWSDYYASDTSYVKNTYSLADDFLAEPPKLTYEETLKQILKNREASHGNYDAIFGKVVNFSWTMAPDGSYDISVKLRSVGDLIESLKINILSESTKQELEKKEKSKDKEEQQSPPQTYPADASDTEIIISGKNKNDIGALFYNAYETFSKEGDSTVTVLSPYLNVLSDPKIDSGKQDFAQITFGGEQTEGSDGNGGIQYYIRLGSLLKFLQDYIVVAFTDKNNNTYSALKMDNEVDNNLMYIQGYQISTDPRICIFNKTLTLKNEDGEEETVSFYPGLEEFVYPFKSNLYGKIMNIYINCSFILKKLDELKDEDGNVALIDFLNNVLSSINSCTGNQNQLEATISPNSDDTIIVIDKVQLPDRDDLLAERNQPTKEAIFEVYGYRNFNGATITGFLKSFEFRTEMTPNMANMVTIGSTSNGNTSHSDSTALSLLNKGVTDKYKVESEDNVKVVKNKTTNTSDTPPTLEEQYKTAIENFNKFALNLSFGSNDDKQPEYDVEEVNNYTETLSSFLQYQQRKKSQKEKKASPQIGFIPFNLTMKMEGLSGPKIYQKYTTDASFLPSSYHNEINFLIKGITNEISDNKWTTTLESYAVPSNLVGTGAKNPTGGVPTRGNVNIGGAITTVSAACPTPNIIAAPPVNQPTSPIRSKALSAAYKYTFYNDGLHNQPSSHLCSKYTYTHAYNYVKSLKNTTKDLKSGGQVSAGGNANQSTYWANLVNLGYTQTKIGTGISKEKIIDLIKNTSYNYGDILVYWASDKPNDKGASQYGHTQMYIGGVIKGITWASDRYTNYNNASFVYNSSKYKCWNLIIFRAPLA